jgi:hypothetical protein
MRASRETDGPKDSGVCKTGRCGDQLIRDVTRAEALRDGPWANYCLVIRLRIRRGERLRRDKEGRMAAETWQLVAGG